MYDDGVTATLHKLTAGDGYTYLTRQVAAGDSTELGYRSLGDYYSVKGESPGTWQGGGLTALGVHGQVTEQQMVSLFGQGIHPDADKIRAAMKATGHSAPAAEAATRLGSPFPQFQPNQQWMDRISAAYAAYNTVRGNAVNKPIPLQERDRIRTDVAGTMFAEVHGRDPIREPELTSFVAAASRPDRSAVAGYDVTFTPVKSVSVLWALAPRATSETIAAAHHSAVEATVRWLEESVAYTRLGAHGVAQVETRGLITAQFVHRDSRAGDPNLHTHVAISNKVQTIDGRWLALDGRMIHRYLVAASERYNTELETRLEQQLGVRFAPTSTIPGKQPIREIIGVGCELIELFSGRRRDIVERRGDLVEQFRQRHHRMPTTIEMIRLAQQANLETRQAKHEPKSLAEQREQWRDQAINEVGEAVVDELPKRAAGVKGGPAPALVDDALIHTLADATLAAVAGKRAQWSRHHVYAEALRQVRSMNLAAIDRHAAVDRIVAMALSPELSVPIGIDPEVDAPVPDELRRSDGTSVYRMAGGQLYTSVAVLEAEERIVAAAGSGGARTASAGDIDLAVLEWSANNNGRTLNTSQAALVRAVAGSDRVLTLAMAPAGTGKTTAMGALAAVWQSAGGTITALSPQASTADELAAQIPGAESNTVDKLIYDLAQGTDTDLDRWADQITPDSLVIIDEAGLASTLQLDAAIAYIRSARARVLLVGDDRQRGAAGAGGVLRDIEATHGLLALDEVLRFADPTEGAASLAIRDGDPAGLGYYLDHGRIHTVTPDLAADHVYHAWRTDRAAGIDSVLIAPTLDQVSELNLRARADRLAGQADQGEPELSLPNGETLSAGDPIITKQNSRRLALGGTDFVRNNYQWMVEEVHDNGSITATRLDTGHTRTLPARYVQAGHVRLGYATTTAGVQGLTVKGTAHSLINPAMTRNDLYPAATRATLENHLYLVVGGVGDTDDIIKPDAVTPPTAAEILTAILGRDGSDRSALTEIRESEQAQRRLGPAAAAYDHALLTGVEHLVGPQALEALTAAAESVVPGVISAPAWDVLRTHLAVLQLQGNDPIDMLTTAAASRELNTTVDLAAVLDWRLDRSGNHSLGAGPLPWLPAIPPQLAADTGYGPYLAARSQLVEALATTIRSEAGAWTPATVPAWAVPYLGDPALLTDLAVWRGAHQVPENDIAPAGSTAPPRIAHRRMHQTLVQRAAAAAGAADDSAFRWAKALAPDIAAKLERDPYWPILASRLSIADTAGAPVEALLATMLTDHTPLPAEAPAAALWWRLSPHLGADTAGHPGSHVLLPAWSHTLTNVLGTDTATAITADRLWPNIVIQVDAAARRGLATDTLITDAATLLASERDHLTRPQLATVLLTHLAVLSDPDPAPDNEEMPPNPDQLPPADLHTATPAAPQHPETNDAPAGDHDMPPGDEELADPDQLPPDPGSEHYSPDGGGPAAADRGRLYQAVADAHDYYRAKAAGSWVPQYLTDRALPADLVGHAPAGWTNLIDHLHDAGYTDTELKAAGLARTSSRGTLIDAFRDRAILPIYDLDGRVVAFTGRANPATLTDRTPKYLNSATTDLYNKAALPYGLSPENIAALRAGARLAIAEGPLDADAITLATGRRTIGVAALGTALTVDQISTLTDAAAQRTTPILTAFDADTAGRAATSRAYHLIKEATGRTDTQAWTSSAGRKDPAEVLQHDGPEQLAAAIDNTAPAADHVVDEILDRWPEDTPEHRFLATGEAAPAIADMDPDQILRQTQRVSDRLHTDWYHVLRAVQEHMPLPAQEQPQRQQDSKVPSRALTDAAALVRQATSRRAEERRTRPRNELSVAEYDSHTAYEAEPDQPEPDVF